VPVAQRPQSRGVASREAARRSRGFRNELLYTGRRSDPETGLQLNRHRFYHQQLGRWVSRDPIGYWGGDANLYGYVFGRPTRFTDPVGLWGWDGDWIELGIGGLLGLHGEDVQAAAGQAIIDNPLAQVGMGAATGAVAGAGSGAVAGVSAGAVVGSVFAGPGPGTATGAGAGALAGAGAGFVTGAVTGAIGALISDDPIDAAYQGTVVGGTAGAVAGAVLGAQAAQSACVQSVYSDFRMSPEQQAFEDFTDPMRIDNDKIRGGSFPDPEDYWGPGDDMGPGGGGYDGWLPPEDRYPN